MPTKKKLADVSELADMVNRSLVTISTSYRGMSVAEMTALRRTMRDQGVDVRVVKNTLLRIAADQAGKPDITKIVDGPTALIFGYNDIAGPAKAVSDYIRVARNALTITGAYLDGEVMPASGVADLATMPNRETMIAQFAGSIQSPLSNFMSLMSSVIQGFAGLVDARASQLEAQAA